MSCSSSCSLQLNSCSSLCGLRLHSLRSLSLHNNLLTYLPREILSLVHLQELSLRGNPLVVRFVKEMTYDPPSLLELAGRTIKSRNIPYFPNELPSNLLRYLDLASKCPNPKCAGEALLFSLSLRKMRRLMWVYFYFALRFLCCFCPIAFRLFINLCFIKSLCETSVYQANA